MPGWGTLPTGTYAPIYANTTRKPMAMRVAPVRGGLTFSFDGEFRLSLSSRQSDQIAEVTYATSSGTIWLLPGGTLYGLHFSPGGLIGDDAAVKLLFFDPLVIARAIGLDGGWSRTSQLLAIRLMAAGDNLPVTSIGPSLAIRSYLEIGP